MVSFQVYIWMKTNQQGKLNCTLIKLLLDTPCVIQSWHQHHLQDTYWPLRTRLWLFCHLQLTERSVSISILFHLSCTKILFVCLCWFWSVRFDHRLRNYAYPWQVKNTFFVCNGIFFLKATDSDTLSFEWPLRWAVEYQIILTLSLHCKFSFFNV